MGEVSIIGLYLAKNVFRANDAGAEASMAFRRKLSRAQLLKFLAERPRMVVMEAWVSAPHWSRTIGPRPKVRLVSPARAGKIHRGERLRIDPAPIVGNEWHSPEPIHIMCAQGISWPIF